MVNGSQNKVTANFFFQFFFQGFCCCFSFLLKIESDELFQHDMLTSIARFLSSKAAATNVRIIDEKFKWLSIHFEVRALGSIVGGESERGEILRSQVS